MDKIIGANISWSQAMTTPAMRFQPLDKVCGYKNEASVLEVALKNGIPLDHSCGGMGSCTTCRIIVLSDPKLLPPRTELEQECADMRGFAEEERLACQLPPLPGLEICLPVPAGSDESI